MAKKQVLFVEDPRKHLAALRKSWEENFANGKSEKDYSDSLKKEIYMASFGEFEVLPESLAPKAEPINTQPVKEFTLYTLAKKAIVTDAQFTRELWSIKPVDLYPTENSPFPALFATREEAEEYFKNELESHWAKIVEVHLHA